MTVESKAARSKTYGAIDGLRTIAAVGILMMHVAANTNYEISGYIYDRVIPSFTNFTFLFMVISAFGMCCGYYEKIRNNRISFDDFYAKRFKKILPFFAALVVLDIVMSPSLSAIYEGFADVTLLFGLLPDAGNITVIGVGWFIGLVFVFYLCFPFFCCLIKNKRCAWMAFAVSLIYNFICARYFEVGRNNILYSACYFMVGGLIYLYKDELERFAKMSSARWIVLLLVMMSIVAYYVIGANTVTLLSVSSILLIYAIIRRGGVLQNRITHFISGISMEIYLSHMVIFRVVEKTGLHKVLGNSWVQYVVTVVMVLGGAIVFSVIMQGLIGFVEKNMAERLRKND